jgi:hypothetical protein
LMAIAKKNLQWLIIEALSFGPFCSPLIRLVECFCLLGRRQACQGRHWTFIDGCLWSRVEWRRHLIFCLHHWYVQRFFLSF